MGTMLFKCCGPVLCLLFCVFMYENVQQITKVYVCVCVCEGAVLLSTHVLPVC